VKVLCVLGRHNYGNAARGLGYEYVNFLPALQRLGYEPVVFESLDRGAYRSFAELNADLLGTVQRLRPELVLTVLLQYEVWTETLDLIRANTPALLVNWATDDSWKYPEFSRFLAPHFHAWASTSPEACTRAGREGHANFVPTQWAASADQLATPRAATECRYTVSFVGSAYGNRRRWIAELQRRGIEVQCFGQGWPSGPVAAEAIPAIYRDSVVSLNFADSGLHLQGLRPYRSRQIKARVFEVPGAGGCLLTENAEHLSEFYAPDQELFRFDGVDQLVDRIRYCLAHPRERDRIAYAGHERTRREHTYDLRFSRLVARARALSDTSQTRKSGDLAAGFAYVSGGHRAGPVLRALRALLVLPARILWGARRGPRAARRLVFELSWRLAGARTYSARGLPGRLFYRDS
jgi:spore maturation protein CgeB